MKCMIILLTLLLGAQFFLHGGDPANAQTAKLSGRWQVKYTLTANGEKNLIIEFRENGSATMTLLDTAADGKTPSAPQPVIWSQIQDRINFSSEVELPIGTCCRDVGTLMLKGKVEKDGSISGKSIFVTSTIDDENFTGFRSMVGTFTAKRESPKPASE